ncbi:uncharacterized protein UV8b_03988 [Ustilaginoidea virens]|nr:uncharacterized protein UV8b_03988 [Ustilaginoidea virens]QUC19747.1 hypothetical protein UV8b_03988 [Ustilaginoidea virens]
MSLGAAHLHPLDKKLAAAASRGFLGVELYWEDLAAYSALLGGGGGMLAAAGAVSELCARLGLRVVSLQPFRDADGVASPRLREALLAEFREWLAVAGALGTRIIGVVPATLPPPRGLLPADCGAGAGEAAAAALLLRDLAALARPLGIRVAYENLCFAAHVREWEQAWERIQLARADNLVFLPDTFNLCGGAYMDPEHPSGRRDGGDALLGQKLRGLADTVPPASMPLLQVADAEWQPVPLTADHPWRRDTGFAPLMALSRNARQFPFERGGYLPVLSVVEAVVAAGWSGWVSMEIFSRTTAKAGDDTIREHADRAWRSWVKLAKRMGWNTRPKLLPGDD